MSEKSLELNTRLHRFLEDVMPAGPTHDVRLAEYILFLCDRITTLEQRLNSLVETEEGEIDW